VIGVVAIASLGILGFTLQAGFMDNMGDVANQIEVTPATGGDGMMGATTEDTLSDRDIRDVRQAAVGASVLPVKEEVVEVEYGEVSATRTAYSVPEPGTLFEADEGRVPAQMSSGILVGSTLAETTDVNVGSSSHGRQLVLPCRRLTQRGALDSTAQPELRYRCPRIRTKGRRIQQRHSRRQVGGGGELDGTAYRGKHEPP